MTRDEWTKLSAKIDAWWPATDFAEDSEQAYFEELERYPTDEVDQAVRACLEDGGDFAPSLARLLAKMHRPLVVAPTFDQAYNRLTRAVRRHGSNEAAAIAELGTEHSALAAFAVQYGWDRFRQEPVDDPGYGGAVRKRLQDVWTSFLEDWADGQRVRLAQRSATAAREISARSGNPRRLEAGRSLPAGRDVGSEDDGKG